MSAMAILGDRIARLTLAEAAEVRTYLKSTYGIEAAVGLGSLPPKRVVVDPVPPPATSFDVVLESVDAAKKLGVIRAVRELTGQGLAEAKGFVEAAPRVVREAAEKADADQLKAKLEAAGATVSLKAA